MNSFQFEQVTAAVNDILTAKYRTPFALSRTVIVRLDEDKKYLVYSPGEPLLEQAQEIIAKEAEVIVVAPSLGHTLGVASWLNAFPNARLVATEATMEKLAKQGLTGMKYSKPESLHLELPEHLGIYRLPDCTSGEIWVTIARQDRTFWLACDGVMNLPAFSESFIKKLLQRIYGLKLGLWITPAFISNITDKGQFKAWVKKWLNEAERPVLIPCHGDVYLDQDLEDRLIQLLEKRLKVG